MVVLKVDAKLDVVVDLMVGAMVVIMVEVMQLGLWLKSLLWFGKVRASLHDQL